MDSVHGVIDVDRDVNIHLENKKVSKHFFWFLWIMYAVVSMTKNCYEGSIASIVTQGVLTKSQTGFITAMFYLFYTPLQIVGGFVVDKYSPERMIKIGLLGAAIANSVIYFNQNYYVMLIAWIFNAVAQFGIWPGVFKIISSQCVRSDRTQMLFYISFSYLAGTMLTYLISAFVGVWYDVFLVSAISLVAFSVALHVYEKHLNPIMKWDCSEQQTIITQKSASKASAFSIFGQSGFFFVVISILLHTVVSRSRSVLSSVLFVDVYNVTPSLANILNTLLLAAGVFGTIIARKFVNRIKNYSLAILLVLLAMIPFLTLCIFTKNIHLAVMVIILCVISAMESVTVLFKTYYQTIFISFGKNGTAAGIINSACAAAYMLAAYVMPLVQENYGWLTLIITWPVIILISALALVVAVIKFRKFVESIM